MNAFELKTKVEQTFNELEKLIAGRAIDQSRSSDDRQVYLLALAGKKATVAHDFMRAVGDYFSTMQKPQKNKVAATAPVMKAFELFLAKQQGRNS
jgi:hypothetical protein